MTVRCFVDTNVLIYAASSAPQDSKKKAKAAELIDTEAFGTSAQVLAEFFVNVTRKGQPPMSSVEALAWMDLIDMQPCAAIDAALVKRAAVLSQQFRISYWDAAIVAAAHELGAETLYTEDLSDGQVYGSVRVVNPFREV